MTELKVIDDGIRIDKYLIDKCNMSRSKIKKLIDNKQIFVNGKEVKASYLVKQDDVITISDVFSEEGYKVEV